MGRAAKPKPLGSYLSTLALMIRQLEMPNNMSVTAKRRITKALSIAMYELQRVIMRK